MDTNLGRLRLSEQIQDSILEAIRSGEFRAGAKLPSERTLMEMFEVGRPSVKEALLMLERKGFVRLQRGVAPIVVEPTPESAIDSISDMVTMMLADATRRSEFYDLRIMLETCAAIDAARDRDAGVIALLEAALDRCRAAAGEPELFRDADQGFHRALMVAAQNSVADAFHRSLIEWGLFNPETGPKIGEIHARVIAQHEKIIEAIRAGDPLAAAEALRRHLHTRRNAAREDT